MLLFIISIIILAFSVELAKYKYKIMHKSRHKNALAILHLFILLVNIIFLYLLLVNYQTAVPLIVKVISLIFMIVGSIVVILAMLHLRRQLILTGNKIIKTGPFKYTRHPIYTSDIIIALGASAFFGSWLAFAYSVILIFALDSLARYEEKELVSRLKGYRAYMKEVPRLI